MRKASQRIAGGLRFMVAAAFFFSLMSAIAKVAGRVIPTSELVFARSVVMLAITGALIRRRRLSLWGVNKPLLVLRGASGFVALLGFFYAVTRLPLADVTAIHFTNPVFTSVFAALFLGEKMGRREIAGLVLSLAGVVFVAKPSFVFGGAVASLDLVAVSVAMLAAVFSAVAYTTVRKLGQSDHHLTVVFYFPLIAAPASIPIMAPVAVLPSGLEWVWLLLLGLVTQAAQVCLTRGLARERAGRAMSVSYVQVVFAAVWGRIAFGETPDAFSFVGAVMIFIGVMLVTRNGARA